MSPIVEDRTKGIYIRQYHFIYIIVYTVQCTQYTVQWAAVEPVARSVFVGQVVGGTSIGGQGQTKLNRT